LAATNFGCQRSKAERSCTHSGRNSAV
jgi:hypothetical protein